VSKLQEVGGNELARRTIKKVRPGKTNLAPGSNSSHRPMWVKGLKSYCRLGHCFGGLVWRCRERCIHRLNVSWVIVRPLSALKKFVGGKISHAVGSIAALLFINNNHASLGDPYYNQKRDFVH